MLSDLPFPFYGHLTFTSHLHTCYQVPHQPGQDSYLFPDRLLFILDKIFAVDCLPVTCLFASTVPVWSPVMMHPFIQIPCSCQYLASEESVLSNTNLNPLLCLYSVLLHTCRAQPSLFCLNNLLKTNHKELEVKHCTNQSIWMHFESV